MQDTVWETKDGIKILVSQMDTSHILNCIAKIRRSPRGWRREYLPRLELELTIRDIQGRG
jgi:hypothetical protein